MIQILVKTRHPRSPFQKPIRHKLPKIISGVSHSIEFRLNMAESSIALDIRSRSSDGVAQSKPRPLLWVRWNSANPQFIERSKLLRRTTDNKVMMVSHYYHSIRVCHLISSAMHITWKTHAYIYIIFLIHFSQRSFAQNLYVYMRLCVVSLVSSLNSATKNAVDHKTRWQSHKGGGSCLHGTIIRLCMVTGSFFRVVLVSDGRQNCRMLGSWGGGERLRGCWSVHCVCETENKWFTKSK